MFMTRTDLAVIPTLALAFGFDFAFLEAANRSSGCKSCIARMAASSRMLLLRCTMLMSDFLQSVLGWTGSDATQARCPIMGTIKENERFRQALYLSANGQRPDDGGAVGKG
jgi:hypothetical protein